jgi:hypothetical protein
VNLPETGSRNKHLNLLSTLLDKLDILVKLDIIDILDIVGVSQTYKMSKPKDNPLVKVRVIVVVLVLLMRNARFHLVWDWKYNRVK